MSDTTTHQGYPLPDTTRTVAEEFFSLMLLVLPMLDRDVYALVSALADKASSKHGHEIGDVAGLVAALEAKLSADHKFSFGGLPDVEGMQAAPDGHIPIKEGERVRFMSAKAALGESVLLPEKNLADLQDKKASLDTLGGVGFERSIANGNANTLFAPGQYIVGSQWVGSPFSGSHGSNQGYLDVERWGSNNYALQTFQSVNSADIQLQRRLDNGAWEPWKWAGRPTVSTAVPSGTPFPGQIWIQVA